MVQAMLLERFQVAELHAAHVAREQLVGRQAGPMVLLAMLHIRRPVAIRLAALLTDERLLVVTGAAKVRMLQCGMLLEQPHGRKGCVADNATGFLLDGGAEQSVVVLLLLVVVLLMMMVQLLLLVGIAVRCVSWRRTVVMVLSG